MYHYMWQKRLAEMIKVKTLRGGNYSVVFEWTEHNHIILKRKRKRKTSPSERQYMKTRALSQEMWQVSRAGNSPQLTAPRKQDLTQPSNCQNWMSKKTILPTFWMNKDTDSTPHPSLQRGTKASKPLMLFSLVRPLWDMRSTVRTVR